MFCIEKNQWILHEKRIKIEANYLLCFEANMRKKIEANFNWGLRLCFKIWSIMWLFSLVANISLYANICNQILTWMWNSLQVLWIFASKQKLWNKYSPVWENMKQTFALKWIFASTCICFASNRIFVCKFVRLFWR